MSTVDIRYSLYWKEILAYLSTMTIKFHPFAEQMEKQVDKTKYDILTYKDNPYYQNICGEYSVLDTPMTVLSVETGETVTFDKNLWDKYPQTASLYTYGSEAYKKLCLTYPNQVGLIKGIIYPVEDMEVAYNARDLTIVQHVPSFLRTNEAESLYKAAQDCLDYLSNRWYIYDYGHEDQYYLVFMAQVYLNLFTALIRQRIENQDTAYVHQLHVFDRLEANGLGKYTSILSDAQARWFYRNMQYLKVNRGRKSNLVLLADNLLKNLKVHLVGKKIFQENSDASNECLTVPEFLSEEIIDYSTVNAGTTKNNTLITESEFMNRFMASSVTAMNLIDTSAMETMDRTLSRIYAEGYYPDYSIDNSVEMEKKFAKTTSSIVSTRLLEFQKYTVHTPYLRHLTVFLFDSLMYQFAYGKLLYNVVYLEPATAIPIDLSMRDAIMLLHYSVYKQYGITPSYLPRLCPVDTAFLMNKPSRDQLPTHYYTNDYKYRLDTILSVDDVLNDITWSFSQKFYSSTQFITLLGRQFAAIVKHVRNAYLESHLTHQRAMAFLYEHLVARETLSINSTDIKYSQWIDQNELVGEIVNTIDQSVDSKNVWSDFATNLISALLPIEKSSDMANFAGALYDNTKYYTQMKNLFIDWTSHDLTYLDTDRAVVQYLDLQPVSVTTGGETVDSEREIVNSASDMETYLSESNITKVTDEEGTRPVYVESYQSETDTESVAGLFSCTLNAVDMRIASETVQYDDVDMIDMSFGESCVTVPQDEQVVCNLWTSAVLISASQPE